MPVNFSIRAPKLPDILRRLGGLSSQQQLEEKRIVDVSLLDTLRDSKTKPPRVPLDTGALQSTGFTEPCKIEGAKIIGAVGYGGVASTGKTVDYAVFVHDNLNGRIKNYKRPGSGPKFLETHFTARSRDLKAELQGVLAAAWRKVR